MQKFSKILLLKLGEKLETMQKRKFCEKNNGNILAIKLHSSKKTKFLE